MKKVIYTLNIGNYAPDITAYTFPLIRAYAKKIGATFHQITERKFPEWPINYEKMQIHELSKGNDWNIYIDADAIIYPDLFDITEFLPRDTVLHWGHDPANNRWSFDEYFRRDGRNIGSAGWFTAASGWCRDFWAPPEITPAEALAAIHPTNREVNLGCVPGHFIDEYVTSRNIARYGLKFMNIKDLQAKHNIRGAYFWHTYAMPIHEKLLLMREAIETFQLQDYYPNDPYFSTAPRAPVYRPQPQCA